MATAVENVGQQPFHALFKFHAKWFPPAALGNLLGTALDAASLSSATPDFYAALNLIETIATYSLIPDLLPAVQFISYSYYQGSRSNRHRRLSEQAWTISQHITASHLGGQFAGTLLDIITGHKSFGDGYKFSAAIGALLITIDKLLPAREPGLPSMHAIQLIRGLRKCPVRENAILREHVALMLGTMLQDEQVFQELVNDGGLGISLDLIESCVTQQLDKSAVETLFLGLELRLSAFELRHQPDMAQIFVEVRRPLPKSLAGQLLAPWQRSLMLDEYDMWETGYRAFLGQLSDSSLYHGELEAFINLSVSAYFQTENTTSRRDFVYTLHSLITATRIAGPVKDILARGMVRIFCHKTQKEKWGAQRNWLFPLLCEASRHSVEATRLVLSIRADAAGEGYLDSTDLNQPDLPTGRAARFYNLYGLSTLSLEALVDAIHGMVVEPPERWDVYNAVLLSLPALTRNHVLWRGSFRQMNILRQAVCDLLKADVFVEPPTPDLSKSYVIVQLIQILTAIISYHYCLPRSDVKSAIVTIINVAGSREYTPSIHCIHALTICCYELPELMASYMDIIINKMTKMVTQRSLAIYVLEFFAGLSRFSDLQDRLRREDFKRIFGVCHSYLQSVRSTSSVERKRTPTSEQSAGMSNTSTDDMAQYVYALAHHVITFWYMALRREDRHGLKEYISGCLRYADIDGTEHIEEQGLVTIDLMDRIDAEEDTAAPLLVDVFDDIDGRIITRHRVTGILLITTETALRTGKTIVTIRRPSGTTQRLLSNHIQQHHEDPEELEKRLTASVTVEADTQDYLNVFPDDEQGRIYGKVAVPRPYSALGSDKIITLPHEDPAVTRAIQSFDRCSALDSHKAGVIFVGEDQSDENQILLNTSGTPDYREFLEDLGSLRKLKGAKFNSQGLDRAEDTDGAYTMVWNNDVTELVYHITTFMPNDVDPKLAVINKKRHIGNDFVNIVFNNSGSDFNFNTFPSAFNYVYIVISPSGRTSFLQAREITCNKPKQERFYNVRVLSRPGFPSLSSAVEVKVVSGASLGGYVRNLALNACVFSLMWQAGDDVGDYPSSWRTRLHMIKRLYTQYKGKLEH
ncbi:Putative tuberin/Ral GTPase-activating protein subunit alpha [Septoria linicola]|uniref:Tuberin/Ral GTPase-activating protein subunit alpha n=1 Tax=Septoria linicola TaxID=215465 RepID=A0A9Q9APS5_9PEZI|nr:putative tuberin/Ral GTPase-activating protein subunit alpha [Septoria linicola]USW49842.1 Putative tuberin/Ral GTPase-activating protein subunit alpha [Septoria linicola]